MQIEKFDKAVLVLCAIVLAYIIAQLARAAFF